MHDVTARQNGTMSRFYCAAVGLNTILNLGTFSSWYLIEVPWNRRQSVRPECINDIDTQRFGTIQQHHETVGPY